MIVSQFHLHSNPTTATITGYRLLLTNLSKQLIHFRVTLRTSAGNLHHRTWCDMESGSLSAVVGLEPAGGGRYVGKYLVSAFPSETVRIRLIPSDVLRSAPLTEHTDAMGYVELTVPMMTPYTGAAPVAQSKDPVPVLLHPFVVDSSPATSYRDPSPVTVSTGKAENEIAPDRPILAPLPEGLSDLSKPADSSKSAECRVAAREDTSAFIEDRNRSVGAVLSFLGSVAGRPQDVEAMNRLLREAEHAVQLVPQPRRRSKRPHGQSRGG